MEHRQRQTQIIEAFKAGNQRFLAGTSLHSSQSSLKKLKEYARVGQSPHAVVLCCSDSRAPVELIFDQDIGDVFVIRVAGNIVAPSLIGSVEFAAITFGTPVVMVMGHTGCGAVTTTLRHIQTKEALSSDGLNDIVSRIKPHIHAIAKIKDMSDEEKVSRAVEANVRASVSQLSHSSRIIEEMLSLGHMQILGAVLDLSTGVVNFLDD
ncbi:MAG TPA: carbonic anhydrase [Oligoflexus sp.]|uniref:carbonic anhydrase n=1 Tax=Oligoflexus sp. TaxID=1971216 RepID=UPI002D55ED8D|nr:carbonic anhydrase [Oligoflexus sp.]HYX39910.1 carbonic anhydrase [Oligoflexus sp.]